MKTFISIMLALFALPASAQEPVQSGTGCIWNQNRGTCMVVNDKDKPVTCDIRVQVTTDKNQKTTKVKTVIKTEEAYASPQFRAAWDDKIERAQIAAKCK